MHKHGDPKETRSAEREANSFASAFLMPAKDVKGWSPRRLTVETIVESKGRWRVSAMGFGIQNALLRLLSDWQYKSICIHLGKLWLPSRRTRRVEREASVIWRKVLTQLWSERTTKNDIAADLHLPLDELEGLIWNLAGPDQRPAGSGQVGLRAAT